MLIFKAPNLMLKGTVDSNRNNLDAITCRFLAVELNAKTKHIFCVKHPEVESIIIVDSPDSFRIESVCCEPFENKLKWFLCIDTV